ncbi:hypothetical protein [Kitasatospora purpeofusca]|uniref:hypothetical protein n=1 Tax=Kitasatospora purpeofusca TaxID=67352 RepID=UPI002251FCC3|nr:hypothetical protein [Kitasatospora purpeofusca]MCX4755373.1 hypothetical protein [Kitasatospora purpeofusca]WSR36753.1 hypothetical protein OG715_40790 [Kitasatospora purpeofusca]
MAERTVDSAAPARGAARPVVQAEAALVRHYRRLVRLAYVALPADRDRHSRVLAAHSAVQRALPSRWTRRSDPAPGDEDPAYTALRLRVLRDGLRPRPARRLLAPRVWGLRLFTPHGGEQDAALEHALATLDAPARAAFALRVVEGLTAPEAAEVLRHAGVEQAERALDAAAGVGAASEPDLSAFDPCAVRVQPTDLLSRRRTLTAVLLVGVLGLTTSAAVLSGTGTGTGTGTGSRTRTGPVASSTGPAPAPPVAAAAGPARLVRVPADLWQHTARVDFTAWPARGDRREDAALLGRATTAWERPGPQTRAEPGTDTSPPIAPPRLLYAGTVDGAAVVLLYDGQRLARYTDGRGGGLDLARADDSDVTTAGAVVLHRRGTSVRYLLAPWVEAAETRRIDRPETPARPLDHPDGLTPAAPGGVLTDCRGATVLQLRSSSVVAEKHAFLLADLGGLVPAHLTYSPPPDHNQPARAPREATGPDALQAWARAGCAVPDGTPGVKQLNLWAFAVQTLPQNAGSASWVCLRADRWTGEGSAATAVLLPAAQGPQRTGGGPGRSCSRFEQDTLGWAWWRSPQGTEFLLAAGSRRVARLTVKGPDWSTDRPVPDHTLAVERPARTNVQVEGVLDGGTRIGTPGGGPARGAADPRRSLLKQPNRSAP